MQVQTNRANPVAVPNLFGWGEPEEHLKAKVPCIPIKKVINPPTVTWSVPGNPQTDKYILPVSGGADSSALAIFMTERFPHVPFEYVFSDTGAEEEGAYEGLKRLAAYLGKPITWIRPQMTLFELIDHYGGFLPSADSRWCTRELKLIPFRTWMKQFEGVQKWMFVGIRADESSRIAFTIDECETVMPFVELQMNRDEIFKILSRSIGVPKTYRSRTRPGCGVCPFQRKAEIVGLLQRSPAEFARGAQYEKLTDRDKQRHDLPPLLEHETGIAANWLHFPIPKNNLVGGRGTSQSLFGRVGLFVGVEFFYDGMYSHDEFIWHRRLVSYSSSLSGIKKQLQSRYAHLLQTSEVFDMSPDDVRAKARFAIYFVEASAGAIDVDKPDAASYTWQSEHSYKQVQHVVSWALRILHAEGLKEDAARLATANELSWTFEDARIATERLAQVGHEVGEVVSSLWFVPVEPSEEEIEEKYYPCPMCQL